MPENNKKLFTINVYGFLSVLVGMLGTATIIATVLPIFSIINGSYSPIWYGINVNLVLSSEKSAVDNFLLTKIYGRLTPLNFSIANFIIASLIPILIFGSFTIALFLLRQLFKNLYMGNYFASYNRKIMYQVAGICLIVPIILQGLKQAILFSIPQNLIIDKVKIIIPNMLSGILGNIISEYFILGLVFILFANIFREGEKLKEENDLTV